MKYTIYFLIALFVITSCGNNQSDNDNNEIRYDEIPVSYPATAKEEVSDDYFGTIVKDEYRWLEYDTAENVMQWVKQQNEVTFSYLE